MNTSADSQENTSDRRPNAGRDVQLQLEELAQAEVLTHTRYPRLGAWYPPLAGVVVGAWIAGFALPIWAQLPLWGVMLVLVGIAIRLYMNRRGVLPNPSQAPKLIRREMTIFLIAYALFIGAIFGLWFVTTWWVTSIFAAVVSTIGIAVYERRYDLAARQSETDAGITVATP